MHRRWVLRGSNGVGARENLSRALSLSPLVAGVLVVRGFDEQGAPAFLSPRLADLPSPEGIPGLGAAADRVARAVCEGETIWIYTDYDVDGVTSAALLADFFEACEAPHRVHLPRRDREGYGLSAETLSALVDCGATLVVTADCGISAVEAARTARDRGVDLVITDHHTPGTDLPDAVAVADPKLAGSTYPDDMIAGVGVAWNLVAAVRSRLRQEGRFGDENGPDLRGLLDLVALGTVADVAPLTGVNRILVTHGLAVLNRRPRPGVDALRNTTRVEGDLRAGNIGFQLGPRLNAGGRLDGPERALALLRSRDREESRMLAESLEQVNRVRREIEQQAVEEALAQVEGSTWLPDRRSLVVVGAWHPGVVGLVASRVAQRYHRPTVALTSTAGPVRGSARSIRGLHLVEALGGCEARLARFGGHAAAAGLELLSLDDDPKAFDVDGFREAFEKAVGGLIEPADLVPVLTLDLETTLEECSLAAVEGLSALEPYGMGNPSPVFLGRDLRLVSVRPIGKGGDHRKFVLEQAGTRIDALAWRVGDRYDWGVPGARVDAAFTPGINHWRGRSRVQLTLEGLRPREGEAPRHNG